MIELAQTDQKVEKNSVLQKMDTGDEKMEHLNEK